MVRQSCALLLDERSGFFSDVRMDSLAVQAVMALRGRLGTPPRQLADPGKYIDERYWRAA